jgi:hypothetical protein
VVKNTAGISNGHLKRMFHLTVSNDRLNMGHDRSRKKRRAARQQ